MAPDGPLRRLDMARARLLDLTRSLRRADRRATGVDRVETAYLTQFLKDDVPCFGLVRTPLGYLLLDRSGLVAFLDRLQATVPWGKSTLLSRLGKDRSPIIQQAESDLRRHAIARASRGRLPAILTQHLANGFDYFNVGHSNLTTRVFAAVKQAGGQTHVLIHDVIPLTHPQFQRPGTVESFRAKVQRVSAHADRVIYNSKDTQQNAEKILAKMGRVPPSMVAHLGTIIPQASNADMSKGLSLSEPYFVTVGTIEPRKNHAFLLDIWDHMGAEAPRLLICGTRGWNNDAVFDRLDRLHPDSPIIELPDLNDATIFELVKNSAGLLFPSHVEGFGLPPLEALTLGARVLCNDLLVLREFLHDKPVYAAASDRNLWISTIKSWAMLPPSVQNSTTFTGPTWADHFKVVLRLT